MDARLFTSFPRRRESMPLDPRMREDDVQYPSFPPLPSFPRRRESMHPWIPGQAVDDEA